MLEMVSGSPEGKKWQMIGMKFQPLPLTLSEKSDFTGLVFVVCGFCCRKLNRIEENVHRCACTAYNNPNMSLDSFL